MGEEKEGKKKLIKWNEKKEKDVSMEGKCRRKVGGDMECFLKEKEKEKLSNKFFTYSKKLLLLT